MRVIRLFVYTLELIVAEIGITELLTINQLKCTELIRVDITLTTDWGLPDVCLWTIIPAEIDSILFYRLN